MSSFLVHSSNKASAAGEFMASPKKGVRSISSISPPFSSCFYAPSFVTTLAKVKMLFCILQHGLKTCLLSNRFLPQTFTSEFQVAFERLPSLAMSRAPWQGRVSNTLASGSAAARKFGGKSGES